MATPEENITIKCETEYKDYSFNAQHDIWTLVSLKAPLHEEEEEDKRAPIDVVAVMDKSGSMAGDKLKLVKKTMEFVLTQLNEKDQLALVTYDSNVYVDFGFLKMTKENKESALTKIKAITDGSATNLSGGLIKGLVQVIDRPADKKNDVASVLLFTDGLANNGITSATGIVAAMKDPKRFDGPSEGANFPAVQNQMQQPPPKMQMRKGKGKKCAPPPPPPSEEIPQSSSEGKPADASVYTFGFGEDHDAELLKKISDAGNGMYYFIETEDKIGESFAHCLGGLMSTVAQGIQMQVTMQPGVMIKDVHSARPCEKEGGQSAKINMGDLQSEEGRDIVLELILEPVSEPYEETPQLLFNVNVDYFNVVSSNLGNAVGSLGVWRPANESTHDDSNVSPVVIKEKSRVSMTKAMKEANQKADSGDYEGAKELLTTQINKMRLNKEIVSKYHDDQALEEEFDAMAADLDECKVNAAHANVWQAKGKKMQMNKMQMYTNQRGSEANAKVFKTKKKAAFVGKSKQFFEEE